AGRDRRSLGHGACRPCAPARARLDAQCQADVARGFRTAGEMAMNVPFRVGQGYDVHVLASGRPLIIGGVTIEHTHGLAGHSDADVLLHALTDALLGAAGLGDIGRHFPDTDPAYRGADSRELLRAAYAKVRRAGWVAVNVDATVHAQAPKIGPHAPA